MVSLIKNLINKLQHKSNKNVKEFVQISKQELEQQQYTLHTIRLCTLSAISHRKQKILTSEQLLKRVERHDVLMVNVGYNWYMDIETGMRYELGGFFGDELEDLNNDLYISSERPLFHICYDTIKAKNYEPNDKLTAYELRQIYNDHKQRWNNRL